MITEILRAAILGALPVFLLSYVVLSKAMSSKKYQRKRKKRSDKYVESKDAEIQASMADETEQTNKFDIREHAMEKWLFFGGGFYGTMAFATFLAIEFGQIVDFFGKLFGLSWSQVFSSIGIDLLVNLFVEAIMNMVAAFTWFLYWPKQITMQNGWIWLIAAYIAFTLAAGLAEKMPAKTLIKMLQGRFANKA